MSPARMRAIRASMRGAFHVQLFEAPGGVRVCIDCELSQLRGDAREPRFGDRRPRLCELLEKP